MEVLLPRRTSRSNLKVHHKPRLLPSILLVERELQLRAGKVGVVFYFWLNTSIGNVLKKEQNKKKFILIYGFFYINIDKKVGSTIKKFTSKISILIIFLFPFIFSSILDFNYTPQKTNDPFVPKVSNGDLSFSYDWNITLGNPTPVLYSGMARDTAGNIYVAGYKRNFDKAPIGSRMIIEIVLQKYDPAGNLIWDKMWGTEDSEYYCYAITLDSENNIYLAGKVYDMAEFEYNMMLVKFDSDGIYQWHVHWGQSTPKNPDIAYGIGIDSEKNVYLAGKTET